MAGTETYHEVPQPYRIQKRLALNQCFRFVRNRLRDVRELTYITLGGEDVYDVMDLLVAFDVRHFKLNIISYEQDEKKAERADVCPIARTLRKIDSVSLKVFNREFPSRLERLRELRDGGPFIYFLDYTGTFSARQSEVITDLLEQGLILADDHILITSCISPRIVHQENFMRNDLPMFKLIWGDADIDRDFRVRNHVEVLLGRAFDRYHRTMRAVEHSPISARLLQKFRYQDTLSPMGLWMYGVEPGLVSFSKPVDTPFEDFPTAFRAVKEEQSGLSEIFNNLLSRTKRSPRRKRR